MPRTLTGNGPLPNGRWAIVVSRYNHSVTSRLLDGALETLAARGVPDEAVDVAWVPGAWELPLAVERLAASGRCLAVIALGAVIRGETTHDQHLNRAVSLMLAEIALRSGVPVPLGLLTCETLEQALQRAGGDLGNKGSEAASAAVEMVLLLRALL